MWDVLLPLIGLPLVTHPKDTEAKQVNKFAIALKCQQVDLNHGPLHWLSETVTTVSPCSP